MPARTRGAHGPLGGPERDVHSWDDDDVASMRLRLADQAAALDSLERRGILLVQPAAFVLALGINNVQRVGDGVPRTSYYGGLVVLIGAILSAVGVLWPRHSLADPTLTPPRHPRDVPSAALPRMLESAWRNDRRYVLKSRGLRIQLVLVVVGCLLIVGSLAAHG